MALKDCLAKIKFDLDDVAEIKRLVAENNGDEAAGVQAFVAGIEADIEDARAQLAEQGFDVAIKEEETASPPPQEAASSTEQAADWWARASRENDGAQALFVLERAGVAFSNRGRPWRDIRPADQERILAARAAMRETVTPANDTLIGKNDAGEPIYQREDGQVYRMRGDRKDRPDGYPDFGGDLVPVNGVVRDANPVTTERTEAGEQAVIPGAEQDAGASLKAEEAAQAKALADAKQRQSKMRTGVGQQEAGPLFDTQGDMFDQRTPPAEPKDEKGDTGAKKERIEDLGEKIGGARKDTSQPIGPRGTTKKADDRPGWAKRYAVIENWDLKASDADKKKFMILDKRTNKAVRENYRTKLFETREEAEAAIPLYEVARNHKVNSRGGGTFDIVRMVSDRKRPTVKGGFASREEAMKYMAQNAVEIIETKVRIDDSIHPALEQALREGEDRRKGGRDVTGQDFMDVFGFRGVEFGNWNNNAERQHILNQAYDALLDMAEILNIPPKAISLNGDLALAFGARGSGLVSARAHYEMDYGVINLTKIQGAGALAHEWWHAVDHYFSRQDGKAKSEKVKNKSGDMVFDVKSAKDGFVTHSMRYNSNLREEVQAAIKQVVEAVYKRRQEFTEDVSQREKIESRAGENLDRELDQFRKELETEARYGRKTAPATKAQLLKVDAAIKRIRDGKLGEKKEAPTKARYAMHVFHEPVLTLAEVYKEVRGRQAYGTHQNRATGVAHSIQRAIDAKLNADKFLADAQEQRVKEKTVRTEYASEAWKMDQGRKDDYWSTEHEMTARAFEAYVYDRLKEIEARNDFLAYEKHNNLFEYQFFGVKPYPEGKERDTINAAFRNLFDTIKTEDTDTGTVRMYQKRLDIFYSPLLRAIEGAKQKQAPAKDWKAIIGKLPGVKKAEVEWLGVEEWLDAQDGQVTREDLTNFIREGQIEIVEEQGGEQVEVDIQSGDEESVDPDPDFIAQNAQDMLDEIIEEMADEEGIDPSEVDRDEAMDRAMERANEQYWEEPETRKEIYDANGDWSATAYWNGDNWFADGEVFDSWRYVEYWAEDEARKNRSDGADFESSFKDYTEDGGENYREILLRVPNLHESGRNTPPGIRKNRAEYDRLKAEYERRRREADQFEPGQPEYYSTGAGQVADKMRNIRLSEMYQEKSPFVQRAHFSQENIVVHARVKDRTGPNGEKILFVEEIQSDLASKWRENQESPEVTARRRELEANAQAARDARDDAQGVLWEAYKAADRHINIAYAPAKGDGTQTRYSDFPRSSSQLRNLVQSLLWDAEQIRVSQMSLEDGEFGTVSEAVGALVWSNKKLRDAVKAYEEARKDLDDIQTDLLALGTEKKIDPSLPDTPFKEEATYTLMVKRLLRMAAEEGYDQVSWTPGYMQAERWNSAAQSVVEGVEWSAPDADSIATARSASGTDLSEYRYVNLNMADGGNTVDMTVDPSGKVEGTAFTEFAGKQLSQIVGPQLARQIMSEPAGSLSGQKITFPDSGYAIAYDQQTRKAVDKIARKHGSQVKWDKTLPDFRNGLGALIVEAGKLPKDEILRRFDDHVSGILSRQTRNMTEGQVRVQKEGIQRRRKGLESAISAGETNYGLQGFSDNDLIAMFPEFSKELSNPVWSVKISDDLRAAAMEPMAIFKRGQRVDANQNKIKALIPALQQRLKDLMIRGVNVEFDPDMLEQGATEIDRNNGIKVLIGNTLNGINTLNHEAVHVLRAMNLFTQKEWDALAAEAEKVWMARYNTAVDYSDLSRDGQIEEAIAQAFADYIDGKKPATTALGNIFVKMKRFFRAMKEALLGQGITRVEDIFDLVDEGRVGSRAQDGEAVTGGELVAVAQRFQRQRSPVNPAQNLFTQGQNAPATFIPDRRVWDELTASGRGIWGNLKGSTEAIYDRIDRARIQVQDRFLPVLRAQQAVEKATGQQIPEALNAYLAEETFSGKVGRHLFEIDEDFTKPIISLIAETNGGLTVDQVGDWLTARHAQERNAYIASINDKMPDGGSGMMNAEASQILSDAASGPHAARLQEIGRLIDALRDKTLDLRVDAGLMTTQDAALWRNQYSAYVPLKGFEETDHYDAMLESMGVGKRYSVTGQETKRALGRKSKAFNPLMAAITQAQEVSIRAEKNRVARAMYDLAAQFPSESLWEVRDVQTKRYYNKTTGRVEEMAVSPASMRLQPNEMAVKVNGKERRIVFHDERLAMAAGTIGADQMGPVMRVLSAASRYFSAVNTMLDPEFVIRNAFRDMTTAQINMRNFGKDDRNKIAKAMVKNWPKAWMAAYRGQLNKADTDWTRWYKEFEESGAKVSFWKLEQPEAGKSDLENRVRLASGNRAARITKTLMSPSAMLSTRDNAALSLIERVNLSVDNAVRLAAYVEARRAGWSKAQAASLSKNLTVNFNRRGMIGANLNAAYPFFNAAMQGSQVLLRAVSSRRMAKYVAALVGYGILEDLVNAALSERDDDDELAYDKIPDWKLEMNLVWMASQGEAVTVPLPYGYNVFPYMGKQIGKAMRGVKDPGEAMGDVIKATFSAFSPIAVDQSDNPGQNVIKFLSPMATDPLIELATNRDWLDRPIRPESPYNDFGPDAYKYYGGASKTATSAADFLNRLSGGNRAEPGFIDISPEYLDHLFGFASGGAGRFVGRATDATAKLISGDIDLIEQHRVPFARSVTTTTGHWLDRDRFYSFREEVNEAVNAVKTEDETGDPVREETRQKASLKSALKIADKRMKIIRDEKKAAGDAATKAQRDDWEKRESKAVLDFNKKYIGLMGPQAE